MAPIKELWQQALEAISSGNSSGMTILLTVAGFLWMLLFSLKLIFDTIDSGRKALAKKEKKEEEPKEEKPSRVITEITPEQRRIYGRPISTFLTLLIFGAAAFTSLQANKNLVQVKKQFANANNKAEENLKSAQVSKKQADDNQLALHKTQDDLKTSKASLKKLTTALASLEKRYTDSILKLEHILKIPIDAEPPPQLIAEADRLSVSFDRLMTSGDLKIDRRDVRDDLRKYTQVVRETVDRVRRGKGMTENQMRELRDLQGSLQAGLDELRRIPKE